jgi:hypothetical protein
MLIVEAIEGEAPSTKDNTPAAKFASKAKTVNPQRLKKIAT